jgi:hypothetical protein
MLSTEYLDKIFLFAIRLGLLNSKERTDYLSALVEMIPDFKPTENSNIEETNDVPLVTETKENSKINYDFDENDFDENDFGGEIEEPPMQETKTEEKNVPIPEFQPFTNEESVLLKKVISEWVGITPRQIRIFYYRYLFAKNLLIKRYASNPEKNIWRHSPLATHLPEQIQYYSSMYQPELICDKIISLNNMISSTEFYKIPELNDKSVPIKDYLELLSVLEIVVAY